MPPSLQNGTFGMKIVLKNDHSGASARFVIFGFPGELGSQASIVIGHV